MLQITIEQEWVYRETQYYSIHRDVLPEDFHTWTMIQKAEYIQANYDMDDYEAEPIEGIAYVGLTVEDEGGND